MIQAVLNMNKNCFYKSMTTHASSKVWQDLARIRKKLKLTQQQAAVLTGGGKNAFSRYENGQAKPMAAVVNLFRLLERNPKLMKDLSLL